MKIEANTFDDFFAASGDKQAEIKSVDRIISETLPSLRRYLFTSPSITMIAYGEIPYKKGTWPLIGLAPQKNNISIYVMAYKDGKTLPELYSDKLGKVSNGKGCIRFTKLNNINIDELKNLLKDSVKTSYK